MDQQTLELLRALQSSERDGRAFAHIRVLLPQERTRLAATDDRATLADISELLEVWADSAEPALAGVAALEAARIAEDDLEQAERAAQLYLLSIERSPIEGESLRRLDSLLCRRGQQERLEAMLVAHVETLSRTPHAPVDVVAARYRRLGQLRAERGVALDAAIEVYERAVDLAADAETIRELADLYGRRGTLADAAQAADLYCMLAELATPEHGVPLLERALDHAPGHDAALDLLETYVSAGEQAERLERRWAAYIGRSENEAAVDRRRMLLAQAYAGQARERDALICLGPLIEKSEPDALRMQAVLLAALQEHEQRASAARVAPEKAGNGKQKPVRPPTLVGFRLPEPARHVPIDVAQENRPSKSEEKLRADRSADAAPVAAETKIEPSQPASDDKPIKKRAPRSGETLVGFRLPGEEGDVDDAAGEPASSDPEPDTQVRPKAERATPEDPVAPAQSSKTPAKEAKADPKPGKFAASPNASRGAKNSASSARSRSSAPESGPSSSTPSATAMSSRASASAKAAALRASRSSAPPPAARPEAASAARTPAVRPPLSPKRTSSAAPPLARASSAAMAAAAPAFSPATIVAPAAVPVTAPVATESTPVPGYSAADESSTTRRRPNFGDRRVLIAGGAAACAVVIALFFVLRPSVKPEPPPVLTRSEAVAAQPSLVAATRAAATVEPIVPVPPPPAPPVAAAPAAAPIHESSSAHDGAKAKKPGPVPHLTPGKAHVVGGGVTATQVALVVEDALPMIERCYADALHDNPKLKGRIVFGWTVEKSGKPGKVKALSGSLKDESLEQCSGDALHKLKFPKSKKKASEITWPLDYSSKKS